MIKEALILGDEIKRICNQIRSCDNEDDIIDALLDSSRSLHFLRDLHLPEPARLWRALSDSCKTKTAFEQYKAGLIKNWEEMESLMVVRKAFLEEIASPEAYEKRITLGLRKKNSRYLAYLEKEQEYCRIGGNLICQFARSYGALTPCGNPPKEEDISGLLAQAKGVLQYFQDYKSSKHLFGLYCRDYKPQELFDYLYNNAKKVADGLRKDIAERLKQLEQSIIKETREQMSLITPYVFGEIETEISPYFSEMHIERRKHPGPKGLNAEQDSFDKCFVCPEAYKAFMAGIKEYVESKKTKKLKRLSISASELNMVWDMAKKHGYAFLTSEIKYFLGFAELFKNDYPELFTTNSFTAAARPMDKDHALIRILMKSMDQWKINYPQITD